LFISRVETLYPELFNEIKTQVSAGKFFPIGSTWVEMVKHFQKK